MRLPLLSKKPSERQLLAVEYSPTQSRVAYFHDQEGELTFGGAASGPTPEEALGVLPEKPPKLTDIVAGLPISGLIDSSTVVRFRRPDANAKISEDEVKRAIDQIPPLEGEIFFEDLFAAKVDGLPTLEPVDRVGEVVELNYFQVAGEKEHLEKIKDEIKKLGTEPGMVPTSYAIAKLISQTAPKGALVLDIDPHQTEVSLSADGHLVGIKSFDLGGEHGELFMPALEIALEEMEYTDLWPEAIYLLGTFGNYEKIRSDLLAFPWTKKLNMMSFPEITVFHPLSVNLTLPADVGLNALSLLG